MARVFIPAVDHKTVPVVRSGIYDAAETFIKGAVLGLNGDGEFEELTSGAGVTGVTAVALEGVGTKPGHNVANDNLVVWRTGVEDKVSVVDLQKNPDQIFSGRLTDGAGVDVLPTQTLIGEDRGLIRLGDGTWTVNNADVTNDAVRIVDIVIADGAAAHGNYVLFRFLDAVLA
jgi:hypothetical protein